ncbi:MAG: hypothetical protein V4718_04245 [Pseudomonadota bacterium]
MQTQMTTRTIFVRSTDTEGKSYTSEHLVWKTDEKDGADLFIAARQKDAADLNAKSKNPNQRKAKAEIVTRETYLKEKSQ